MHRPEVQSTSSSFGQVINFVMDDSMDVNYAGEGGALYLTTRLLLIVISCDSPSTFYLSISPFLSLGETVVHFYYLNKIQLWWRSAITQMSHKISSDRIYELVGIVKAFLPWRHQIKWYGCVEEDGMHRQGFTCAQDEWNEIRFLSV